MALVLFHGSSADARRGGGLQSTAGRDRAELFAGDEPPPRFSARGRAEVPCTPFTLRPALLAAVAQQTVGYEAADNSARPVFAAVTQRPARCYCLRNHRSNYAAVR